MRGGKRCGITRRDGVTRPSQSLSRRQKRSSRETVGRIGIRPPERIWMRSSKPMNTRRLPRTAKLAHSMQQRWSVGRTERDGSEAARKVAAAGRIGRRSDAGIDGVSRVYLGSTRSRVAGALADDVTNDVTTAAHFGRLGFGGRLFRQAHAKFGAGAVFVHPQIAAVIEQRLPG